MTKLSALQVRSTVNPDGTLYVALAQTPFPPPRPGEITVKIEATPINPADLIPLLAGADPATALQVSDTSLPALRFTLSPSAHAAASGRIGVDLLAGLEGAGTVVAAGEGAENLIGTNVAVLSVMGGCFAQYCTVPATSCIPLPAGVPTSKGAALFCNPLTALAMLETLKSDGHRAIVHTAAASNLGQMLVRICAEDGIALVNIVRRREQEDLLRSLGAIWVCNASDPSFDTKLHAALMETGATVAFDALGGGSMAGRLVAAMERAALAREGGYQPFGSIAFKEVHIYGGLDPSPTILPRSGYGMTWAVSGWAMPPVLQRAGDVRKGELMNRIVNSLESTFASHFAEEISLVELLHPAVMREYCSLTTGRKFLVKPWS